MLKYFPFFYLFYINYDIINIMPIRQKILFLKGEKHMKKSRLLNLLSVPIIGNILAFQKIQDLEEKLEREKNPTFEQARDQFYSEICFSDWEIVKTSPYSDWVYFKTLPRISFWPTWEEAIEHSTECSTNSGDLRVYIHKAVNDNFYIGIWNENQEHSPAMNSQLSLNSGNMLQLSTVIPDSGIYRVAVNYKGVSLFSSLEVTVKK